jgi:hypothetical protein
MPTYTLKVTSLKAYPAEASLTKAIAQAQAQLIDEAT